MTFRADRFHWDDDVDFVWYPARMADWNPDQPREPAGSPEGGQWSPGGGGGGEGGGGSEPTSTASSSSPKAISSAIEARSEARSEAGALPRTGQSYGGAEFSATIGTGEGRAPSSLHSSASAATSGAASSRTYASVATSKHSTGLVPGDAEKFHALKAKWAAINADMLKYVETRRPDSPEAQAGITEMAALVKQMGALHADPGGAAGIGLPGGPRDVVIVGAGPGGLTAGIHGAAEGLDTLLVESNIVAGGQAKYTSRVENYGGFPLGVTGEHLTQDMLQQAERLGAQTKLGVTVKEMSHDPSTGLKTVTLSNGETIETRTVIIAGGLEFRKLEKTIPGSEGPGVIYGGQNKELVAAARGGAVCVIGGSNGAAQSALGCAEHCQHVYLMSRSPIEDNMSDYVVSTVRANPKITVVQGEIAAVHRDEHNNPQALETKTGEKLPVNAVGVFIGSVPNTRWVPSEVKTTKGLISTDEDLVASIPGVFAVGDVRDKGVGRIVIAAGEGAMALKHAVALLEEQKEALKAATKKDAIYRDAADISGTMDSLINRLLDLDLDHPWFGQTAEKDHASENQVRR